MANRKNVVKREPVATAGVVAGLLIFLASKLGIVLDQNTADSIISGLVPIILALIARAKVTPVN